MDLGTFHHSYLYTSKLQSTEFSSDNNFYVKKVKPHCVISFGKPSGFSAAPCMTFRLSFYVFSAYMVGCVVNESEI